MVDSIVLFVNKIGKTVCCFVISDFAKCIVVNGIFNMKRSLVCVCLTLEGVPRIFRYHIYRALLHNLS